MTSMHTPFPPAKSTYLNNGYPSRRAPTPTWLVAICTALLSMAMVGCGGGSTSAGDAGLELTAKIAALRVQALAKMTEAKALGIDGPCITNSQCKALMFSAPDSPCPQASFHPYASLAPTAGQAETAAAEQRTIAAQANTLAYPAAVCPAIAIVPPALVCNANKCSLATN